LLLRVLEATRRRAPEAIVVFDLDSTLLDNRPRQARIFREFADEHAVPELASASPDHWLGWDLRVPLRNLGLPEPRVVELMPVLKGFWRDRFFTSDT
jgi:phosphoglycolate phosphatase-like HAD superfamily hydrolase